MITFLLILFIVGIPLAFILVSIGAVVFGWQAGTRGVPVEVQPKRQYHR